jgi:cell pole-organizing protein PopZ
MTEPARPADLPSFQTIDGQPDVVFSDVPASEPAPRVVDEAKRQYASSAPPERTLLSNTTSAAVDSAYLPGMVERIVRSEIERVSRGRS